MGYGMSLRCHVSSRQLTIETHAHVHRSTHRCAHTHESMHTSTVKGGLCALQYV